MEKSERLGQIAVEDLKHKLQRLRSAIEVTVASGRSGNGLKGWPTGCCDKPYLVLFLYDLGYRKIVQRKGDVTRFGGICHDWIEVDGITVDITADQFDGLDLPPVIVTCHSDWHAHLPRVEFDGTLWSSDRLEAYYRRHRSKSVVQLLEADAYAEIVKTGNLETLFPNGPLLPII